MANRRKQLSRLDQAAKEDLQRLFERMADAWAGKAEMTSEGPGWVKVRLSAYGEEPAECKITMAYNESGIPLVCVESLTGPGPAVHVSPLPSAVIAVMTR